MNEQELTERIAASVNNSKRLETMTNQELADLLMNTVWAGMELFTPKSDLVSAVIDRLRGEKEKVK